MKSFVTFLSCFICIQVFACCNQPNEMAGNPDDVLHTGSARLKISVGTHVFTATLYNNATVTAFKARLPLTIQMRELNKNEKYVDLPDPLPAGASDPGTIQAGDLRLYGTNTLVLFYKTFSTSYPYTPMGRIDDASGLAAALGTGNVSVTFALQ
ncbi:MAG TPA: cyclophilin-like fold protein [Chitinophagaceae bacterium]|nr:cyclophilin-like fold protein [Chitinophagaceae bacterium]